MVKAAAGAAALRRRQMPDIAALERMPAAEAKAEISDHLCSRSFARFLSGGTPGARPIAVLDAELVDTLGARARVVRVSRYTASKQRANHPDISPLDYARVQRMLDAGEVIQQERHHLVVLSEDPKPYQVVVKATKSGGELYLQSYRRTDAKGIKKARQRGKIIRRAT